MSTRSESDKAYYQKNREARLQWQREYYQKNREKRQQYIKEYDAANLERLIEYRKDYRKINATELNHKKREYIKKKYSVYPLSRFKKRIRTLIYTKLKNQGYTKRSKTFEILGCEYNKFLEHISSKFSDGMSWENYGEWHLDHIVPVAIAKTEEEVIQLNHYTNFQPLWAIDNLRKGVNYV